MQQEKSTRGLLAFCDARAGLLARTYPMAKFTTNPTAGRESRDTISRKSPRKESDLETKATGQSRFSGQLIMGRTISTRLTRLIARPTQITHHSSLALAQFSQPKIDREEASFRSVTADGSRELALSPR